MRWRRISSRWACCLREATRQPSCQPSHVSLLSNAQPCPPQTTPTVRHVHAHPFSFAFLHSLSHNLLHSLCRKSLSNLKPMQGSVADRNNSTHLTSHVRCVEQFQTAKELVLSGCLGLHRNRVMSNSVFGLEKKPLEPLPDPNTRIHQMPQGSVTCHNTF